MKDLSTCTVKPGRNLIYPKRRPSPHRDGIVKNRLKASPNLHTLRRTPILLKEELQRQRQAQILAMRKDGIYVEEEYREEICFYMHEMERYTMSSSEAMDQQPEIRWHMRPCLVDFLVEIHFTFRLRPETLYLTLNIIDRYVSRRIVYTKHYQLVGCAALWIAAKFEDAKERVPTVQDLVLICRQTYESTAFIQMEGHVLATIQWTLGHPTAEAWLRFYCCGMSNEESKVQHVARFLMEITLFYREFIEFAPSVIALASLILARYTCQKPRRPFEETQECMKIVDLLDSRLATNVAGLSETLVKKYAFGFYSKASTHIVQWYLIGNRFDQQTLLPNLSSNPATPATPKTNRLPLSSLSTPMSAMTVSSDTSSCDDFLPVTPSPISVSVEPFISISSHHNSLIDKENVPTLTENIVLYKQVTEDLICHTSRTTNTFGRHALHDLNICSPSPRPLT